MNQSMKQRVHVCMLAYANYYTDARIKNYVDALLDAGGTVDVVALGDKKGITVHRNLWVRILSSKHWGSTTIGYVLAQSLFLLRAMFILILRSMKRRYDIVHVHNMPDVLVLAALPLKLAGTRIILDIHDTMPEAYATKFGYTLSSFPTKLLVFQERLSARLADIVLTTNVMHKEILMKHGLPADKIDVIMNVGNRKVFKPRDDRSNGCELWLGYHGTIARRLGLNLIIEALRILKGICPELRFLCIGEGDDRKIIQQLARDCGVDVLIEWHDFTDVEKLPEVLKRIDVGIIGNSRQNELKQNHMLPVKMLEYAAMEIPTIAPRLKVIESYFDDSSAFLYEPDQAEDLANVIRKIYEDRSLPTTKIPGIRKFNTTFNWEHMSERYLSIVNELSLMKRA